VGAARSSYYPAVPRQSPVPDEIDKPFWDACNEGRLIMQHCGACDRYQYPPESNCRECGSADRLGWRQIQGRGTIYSYGVIHDTPIASLQPDQPFNVAVIDLDECPGINVLSHLPGTPVDEVPIGAPVELTFVVTPATGQKVPEWTVVG
jgi:uncharacterized OB-fold protein